MAHFLTFLQSNKKVILIAGLALIALLAVMTYLLPPGVDWSYYTRPAVYQLLSGQNPYQVDNFFNAPWTLLPLIPLALLPERLSRAILVVVTLACFAFTAYRLGARRFGIAVLLLSPPVMHCVLTGNLDWMAALGFVLPPQIGLFFVSIKPQMGSAVAVFWLVEAWREGGWRGVLRTFWPITLALVISFLIFGLWPLKFEQQVSLWSASLWPTSIPIGLGLLAAAIHKRRIEYSLAAAPCLSPYLMMHSWVGALLALSASTVELAAAVAGFWILIILRAVGV